MAVKKRKTGANKPEIQEKLVQDSGNEIPAKKEENKQAYSGKLRKNKNPTIVYILASIILILVIVVAFFVIKDLKKECKEVQVPFLAEEDYVESVPYSEQECALKSFVYSASNFSFSSSECLQQTETYCLNRKVTCSIVLTNFEEERGTLAVDFTFYPKGSNISYGKSSSSQFIYPKTSSIILGTYNIQVSEPFNATHECAYNITYEPKKQTCQAVTKYKDVNRTKTITEYRTEQICS
jgi:hypothetical protein